MESRDDQRRGGGNPAPATTCIILSRSGAGYLGSYEARSKLNDLIAKRNALPEGESPPDDLIADMDAATKVIDPLEVQYRAALTTEGEAEEKAAAELPRTRKRGNLPSFATAFVLVPILVPFWMVQRLKVGKQS